MQCRLEYPEPVPVGDSIRANHLYRIAQEAVNNAVKYSGGSEIVIRVRSRSNDGAIELRVEDDGRGLERSPRSGSGLGLHIMRYRANAMNGVLEIEPGPAGGASVVCIVPAKAPR